MDTDEVEYDFESSVTQNDDDRLLSRVILYFNDIDFVFDEYKQHPVPSASKKTDFIIKLSLSHVGLLVQAIDALRYLQPVTGFGSLNVDKTGLQLMVVSAVPNDAVGCLHFFPTEFIEFQFQSNMNIQGTVSLIDLMGILEQSNNRIEESATIYHIHGSSTLSFEFDGINPTQVYSVDILKAGPQILFPNLPPFEMLSHAEMNTQVLVDAIPFMTTSVGTNEVTIQISEKNVYIRIPKAMFEHTQTGVVTEVKFAETRQAKFHFAYVDSLNRACRMTKWVGISIFEGESHKIMLSFKIPGVGCVKYLKETNMESFP